MLNTFLLFHILPACLWHFRLLELIRMCYDGFWHFLDLIWTSAELWATFGRPPKPEQFSIGLHYSHFHNVVESNWNVFTFDNCVIYSHHSWDDISIIWNRLQVRTSIITFTQNNFPVWMMCTLNSKMDEIFYVHKVP